MFWFTARQLKSSDPDTRKRAAARLGTPGNVRALARLVPLLKDPLPEVRAAGLKAVGGIGDPSGAEAILQSLREADPPGDPATAAGLREVAVGALLTIGAPTADALVSAATDKHVKVREVAVEALGGLRDARAAQALSVALRDDRSSVRQAAARGLARVGDGGAVRTLLGAVDHRDGATRKSAIEALGARRAAEAVPALTRALRDRERPVRQAAVEALGRIASHEAIRALLDTWHGTDRELHQAAALTLKPLDWQPSGPRERADHAVLRSDWPEAARQGPSGIEALTVALGEREAASRRSILDALASTGDANAAPALVASLADQDEGVRAAAVEGLVRLGAPAGLALCDALGERAALVRQGAANALSRIGEEQVAARLLGVMPGAGRGQAGSDAVRVTADELLEQVQRAADALRALVVHAAARLPVATLQQLARLPDAVRPAEAGSGSGSGSEAEAEAETSKDEERVSNAEVRRLAGRELARRS
jgi:HEAT repeat protein